MSEAALAPASWSRLVRAIEQMPSLLKDAPGADQPEGMRYLLRFLQAGLRICIEAEDTAAPMLTRSIEHRMTWGLDNPDTTYLYSRLAPGRSYRLTGDRGSARHLEVQVNTGHQGDGDFSGWTATWWATGTDLGDQIDLEIPAHPDASFLLIRQYFSDWETERSARLDLQCLEVPLPPQPLTQPDLEGRIDLLIQWLTTGLGCWDALARGFIASVDEGARAWEVQPFLPPDEASGLKGQAYGMGGWRCQPDEAVILELRPPPSRYWGVSLCDQWWQSIDYAQRQSSLNDSQAVPDDDGTTFTCVIAHDDPGVSNWLDPGGRTEGSLAVRYLFPEGGLPPVRATRVARAELESALPTGVRRTDPATRQQVLRDRQASIARRLAW
ncbi:MAG: hypothetical protein JWP74_2882 [Marmoricola sp.]|nr:hypothetical protein [Marmoricola sp.]